MRPAPARRAPITAPRPTRPQPEHGHRRARLDLRGEERGRRCLRGEPAGERGAASGRRLGIDLGQRDLGHHRVLREGRGAHEVAERLALAGETRGPVGKVAGVLLIANRQTPVRPLAPAVDALAALGREQRDHLVTGAKRGHAAPHLLDDAGALVAEDAGGVSGRIGPRGRVQVGVADPAGAQPDQSFPVSRLVELHLLHDEWATELLEHRRAHPHRPYSTNSVGPRSGAVSRRKERDPVMQTIASAPGAAWKGSRDAVSDGRYAAAGRGRRLGGGARAQRPPYPRPPRWRPALLAAPGTCGRPRLSGQRCG